MGGIILIPSCYIAHAGLEFIFSLSIELIGVSHHAQMLVMLNIDQSFVGLKDA